MPGVDWIPGVSQVKSFCQLVTGDVEGAARTQENFVKECPVVSQVTSTVQLIAGDEDGALETQKRCLGTINNVANGIPVVGHVKGIIHHAVGDHDGGNEALNAATRSTVVISTGVVAGVASGGLAAIPAGMAAGVSYDLADSAISEKPKGFVAAVDNVVNKPNAGNVFDAAAVMVGDGLAGYSGGQIGKSIAKQVKLNTLETVRAAKTEQLNNAMFAPEGSSSSMTSGAFKVLGEQINTLTNEINTLRQVGPQYYFDVKTRQVVVEYPASSGKGVFVPGNPSGGSSGQGRQRERPNTRAEPRTVIEVQDTGLDADFYAGEVTTALTPEQRAQKVVQYRDQKPGNQNLEQSKADTQAISERDLDKLNDQFDRDKDDDPKRDMEINDLLDMITQLRWLHLRMPNEFEYTGAILTNDTFQGLLHMFIRHWDQWVEFIPDLDPLMRRLGPIRHFLETIRNAMTREDAGNAINNFNTFLRQLDNATFVELRSALLGVQSRLHRFLQRNLTSVQYLEEGVTDRGQIQVYFKVVDRHGNTHVMVVGVSRQYYPSVSTFGDRRPVRTFTTIFFITWDDYLNLLLRSFKAWPKK